MAHRDHSQDGGSTGSPVDGLATGAARIGTLADDTRRALYEYVVAQREPVGREEAAGAVGVRLHTASFHLDKLVDAGLLVTEFRRLTGRRGPGAGRPSKLYLRAEEEVAVSLPARRYDLAGDILAAAITRAASGTPLAEALAACAREEGLELGHEAGDRGIEALATALRSQGYEPFDEDGDLALANCPFDTLAKKHTDLICGVNCAFVQGVSDGMAADRGAPDLTARLAPQEGRCCVRVTAG